MIVLTRKERDKQLRKTDIMKAAERIFALKGFYAATIQDIAREAQYAIGTVYLYFKDKDSLYLSLVEDKMDGLLSIIKQETDKFEDAEDKIKAFIQESLEFFEKNQDFFRIFFSERSQFQVVRDAKLVKSSVISQHKEFVVELIKKGQEQKIIRSDFNPRQLANIFTSIFMTVIIDWIKDGPRDMKDLKYMSDFIFDMFLNGAGKRK